MFNDFDGLFDNPDDASQNPNELDFDSMLGMDNAEEGEKIEYVAEAAEEVYDNSEELDCNYEGVMDGISEARCQASDDISDEESVIDKTPHISSQNTYMLSEEDIEQLQKDNPDELDL